MVEVNPLGAEPTRTLGDMSASTPATADAVAPRWLTEDEQQAWIAVARMILQLPSALDAQLQHDSGLNFFEYMLLSRLSMTPERTMRMSELAEVIGGSLSRLSNVMKRLEGRGYVRREPDPVNGRYTNAILTDTGWDKVVASAPGHVNAVRHLVIDPLVAEQITALAGIGQQLEFHVRGQCEGAHDVVDDGDCGAC